MATPRDPEELRQAFAETVAEILGIEPGEVRPDKTWDELDADSLALTEISLILDDAFGIRLPDVDPADMRTVGDALALVERAVAERAASAGSKPA
ncbi:MAG TPA: acyl carrier protein [Acidimicrobiales bacterium]|nr:acyl carrier protein [Acidimicrobiales bacterium]